MWVAWQWRQGRWRRLGEVSDISAAARLCPAGLNNLAFCLTQGHVPDFVPDLSGRGLPEDAEHGNQRR